MIDYWNCFAIIRDFYMFQLQKVGLQDQLTMDSYGTDTVKDLDQTSEEEYATQSKLIKEFITIPSIDKAWIFNSGSGNEWTTFHISNFFGINLFHFYTAGPQAMVAMSQANLLANKRRKFMLSGHISKESSNLSVNFHWAPFPVEMTGASAFVPSPSGLKLLVVRNPDDKESPTKFEIWSSSQLEKEFHIPQKVHGSVYVDGWYSTFLFGLFQIQCLGEVERKIE